MKTRQPTNTSISSDTNTGVSGAPSQAEVTSPSPTVKNRPTIGERKARYRANRNLPVHQRDTNLKKVKTEKQGGAADIPQANKPGNRWDQFTKAVTADGELKLFGLSENDVSELIAWLQTSPDSVHFLEIVCGEFGDSGIPALADILRSNTTLTTLKLENCKIDEEGAAALAEALKVNQTITTLGLTANWIRSGGAKALANSLLGNTTLTTLELGLNGIEYEGAAALADLLRGNTALSELSISDNNLGDYCTAALVEALEVNKKLITLNLRRNRIGPHGAGALAKALLVNDTLNTLYLHGNFIGDAGAEALAQA
jgi:Ran GTPase-activating protein (RanGAP) involved in mRNA processing and transport